MELLISNTTYIETLDLFAYSMFELAIKFIMKNVRSNIKPKKKL